MRDPARIDRILARLRTYWTAYPDMRLAQIVVNAANPKESAPQVYYVEDGVIEEGIPGLADAPTPAAPLSGPGRVPLDVVEGFARHLQEYDYSFDRPVHSGHAPMAACEALILRIMKAACPDGLVVDAGPTRDDLVAAIRDEFTKACKEVDASVRSSHAGQFAVGWRDAFGHLLTKFRIPTQPAPTERTDDNG